MGVAEREMGGKEFWPRGEGDFRRKSSHFGISPNSLTSHDRLSRCWHFAKFLGEEWKRKLVIRSKRVKKSSAWSATAYFCRIYVPKKTVYGSSRLLAESEACCELLKLLSLTNAMMTPKLLFRIINQIVDVSRLQQVARMMRPLLFSYAKQYIPPDKGASSPVWTLSKSKTSHEKFLVVRRKIEANLHNHLKQIKAGVKKLKATTHAQVYPSEEEEEMEEEEYDEEEEEETENTEEHHDETSGGEEGSEEEEEEESEEGEESEEERETSRQKLPAVSRPLAKVPKTAETAGKKKPVESSSSEYSSDSEDEAPPKAPPKPAKNTAEGEKKRKREESPGREESAEKQRKRGRKADSSGEDDDVECVYSGPKQVTVELVLLSDSEEEKREKGVVDVPAAPFVDVSRWLSVPSHGVQTLWWREGEAKEWEKKRKKEMHTLSEVVEEHYRANVQREEDLASKMVVVDRVQKAMDQRLLKKGASLRVVGSSLSGLAAYSSNLDISLLVDSKRRWVGGCMQRMMASLGEVSIVDEYTVMCIVPVSMEGCSSLHTTLTRCTPAASALYFAKILALYDRVDDRLGRLCLFIKHWFLEGVKKDTPLIGIGSYALTSLLIHFLQCGVSPPVLPCLHSLYTERLASESLHDSDCNAPFSPPLPKCKNKQSLSSLLLGFFDYFSAFPFHEYAISIRQGRIVKRESLAIAPSTPLAIEDPFDNSYRSSGGDSDLERLQKAMRAAAAELRVSFALSAVPEPLPL